VGEAGEENPGEGSGVTVPEKNPTVAGPASPSSRPIWSSREPLQNIGDGRDTSILSSQSLVTSTPWHLVWQGLAEQNEAGASEHP